MDILGLEQRSPWFSVRSAVVPGLIGRPKKMVLRMGVDSLLVVLMSLGGLFLLYHLRR